MSPLYMVLKPKHICTTRQSNHPPEYQLAKQPQMRFLYLSLFRATNTQASLHTCADSPNHFLIVYTNYMRELKGETGGPPEPLKNHRNHGFLSNTGPDPLKIIKLLSQHSMLGHHLHASETPFKWRFAGGPMMARLYWYFDPPPLIN